MNVYSDVPKQTAQAIQTRAFLRDLWEEAMACTFIHSDMMHHKYNQVTHKIFAFA